MEDLDRLKAELETARRDVEVAQVRLTELMLHRAMLERLGRSTFSSDELLEKFGNELVELRAMRDFAQQRLRFVKPTT